MTDYNSQGKTRVFNPVEFAYSKDCHSIYTALSRCTSAAGTLILTDIHKEKITGGLSRSLKREYREIELLDNITLLKYNGQLDYKVGMASDRRIPMLKAFREQKGHWYVPGRTPDALDWTHSQADDFPIEVEEEDRTFEWEIITEKNLATKPTQNPNLRPAQGTVALYSKPPPQSLTAPAAPDDVDTVHVQHIDVRPQCASRENSPLAHKGSKSVKDRYQDLISGPSQSTVRRPPNATVSSTVSQKHGTKRLRTTSRQISGCLPLERLKKQRLFSPIFGPPTRQPLHNVDPRAFSNLSGPAWSQNSCAYDSVFTLMYTIWAARPRYWESALSSVTDLNLKSLLRAFEQCRRKILTVDKARDAFRSELVQQDPIRFPGVGTYVSVSAIFSTLLRYSYSVLKVTVVCELNHKVAEKRPTKAAVRDRMGISAISTSDWMESDFRDWRGGRCRQCSSSLIAIEKLLSAPPMISLHFSDSGEAEHMVTIVPEIAVTIAEKQSTYCLARIIYFGGGHFTVRYVDSLSGSVWSYDGMGHASHDLVYEGKLVDLNTNTLGGRFACSALYILLPS
ncbi:hypothetical protein PM082_021676 [Marasmius tenuissimus]|nr:hypothetical protein PM082_021676 [Marasmius tenuissimus]